jgi:hypothetical protein
MAHGCGSSSFAAVVPSRSRCLYSQRRSLVFPRDRVEVVEEDLSRTFPFGRSRAVTGHRTGRMRSVSDPRCPLSARPSPLRRRLRYPSFGKILYSAALGRWIAETVGRCHRCCCWRGKRIAPLPPEMPFCRRLNRRWPSQGGWRRRRSFCFGFQLRLNQVANVFGYSIGGSPYPKSGTGDLSAKRATGNGER